MDVLYWRRVNLRNNRPSAAIVSVGIAGGGVEGFEKPQLTCTLLFMSENLFKISIPVQNFNYFDIWPPSSF